jgi:hypothetical protein
LVGYILGFLFIYSAGTKDWSAYGFVTIEIDDTLQYYLLAFTFVALWIFAFIDASQQFVLASSAAIWYFS